MREIKVDQKWEIVHRKSGRVAMTYMASEPKKFAMYPLSAFIHRKAGTKYSDAPLTKADRKFLEIEDDFSGFDPGIYPSQPGFNFMEELRKL